MFDVWIKIFHTSGTRIYSLIVGLAALAITARWLGPVGRGEMAAALVWVGVLFTIGSASLSAPVLNRAGKGTDPAWLRSAVGTLIGFDLISSLAMWGIAAGLFFFVRRLFGQITPMVLLVALIAVPLLIWEQYGNNLLLATNRLHVSNVSTVVGKSVYLAAIVAAWKLHLPLYYAFIALILGQGVYSAMTLGHLRRELGGPIGMSKSMLRELMPDALRFHLSTVAVYIQSSSGILIINSLLGKQETGFYQFAFQLIDVMLVVPYASMAVLYGKLSEVGSAALWKYERELLWKMTGIMALLSAVAALLAPWGIGLVAGKNFIPSAEIFRWLLIAVVFVTINAVMNPQWIARGMFGSFALLACCVSAFNLGATYLLTKRFGVSGTIAAFIASVAATAIANLIMAGVCEREYRAVAAQAKS